MGITTLSVGILVIILAFIGLGIVGELINIAFALIKGILVIGFKLVVVAIVCVVAYGCYLGYNFVF